LDRDAPGFAAPEEEPNPRSFGFVDLARLRFTVSSVLCVLLTP
jgi:hypothetical protein